MTARRSEEKEAVCRGQEFRNLVSLVPPACLRNTLWTCQQHKMVTRFWETEFGSQLMNGMEWSTFYQGMDLLLYYIYLSKRSMMKGLGCQ